MIKKKVIIVIIILSAASCSLYYIFLYKLNQTISSTNTVINENFIVKKIPFDLIKIKNKANLVCIFYSYEQHKINTLKEPLRDYIKNSDLEKEWALAVSSYDNLDENNWQLIVIEKNKTSTFKVESKFIYPPDPPQDQVSVSYYPCLIPSEKTVCITVVSAKNRMASFYDSQIKYENCTTT